MGEMQVPADRLWAAQTQRSHENFKIGVDIETMPREITHAFGILKKAAALANAQLKPEKMTGEKLAAMLEEKVPGAKIETYTDANGTTFDNYYTILLAPVDFNDYL